MNALPDHTVPETPHTSTQRSDSPHPLAWPGVTHWERVFALGLHLTVLLYHVLLPVLPVLLLWLWKRKRSLFVDDHGRQALNFQITLALYVGVGFLLAPVTCTISPWVVTPAAYILGAVGTTMACVAARHGRVFRYPMTIPFLAGAV